MSVPLGLYVHWPYCGRICPYCDFNVYLKRLEAPGLTQAILDDLSGWRAVTGPRRLASLHFGGGTPSLMAPADAAAVIEAAERLWGFEASAEIGLEANPAERDRYADFRAAGVNRLSIGVQSLDDAALRALGRDHDAAAARAATAAAQAAFDNVSIDLICAREHQTAADWRAELQAALDFGTPHLSVYQLTVEPGTAFAARAARGALDTPDEDAAAVFYEVTQEVCEAQGAPAYEISNHARSAAAQSVHNRLYWEGADWIGAGPGGHSRLGAHAAGGRIAAAAARRPQDYIETVARTGRGVADETVLTAIEEAAERILMGLRLTGGLDRAALRAATGLDVDGTALARLAAEGWLTANGDRVRFSPRGRLLADRLAAELAPET